MAGADDWTVPEQEDDWTVPDASPPAAAAPQAPSRSSSAWQQTPLAHIIEGVEGFGEGFGSEYEAPLGWTPEQIAQQKAMTGVDLEKTSPGILRFGQAADAALRFPGAVMAGISTTAAHLAESYGMDKGQAEALARDLYIMQQVAPMAHEGAGVPRAEVPAKAPAEAPAAPGAPPPDGGTGGPPPPPPGAPLATSEQVLTNIAEGKPAQTPAAPVPPPPEPFQRRASPQPAPAPEPPAEVPIPAPEAAAPPADDWIVPEEVAAPAQAPPVEQVPQAARPQDLLQFLAKRGGLRGDDAYNRGDLQAIGAHEWHREAPFRPRLVQPPGTGKGESLDYAREAAAKQGYGTDYNNFETTDDLLRAIDDGMRGKDVFAEPDRLAAQDWQAYRESQMGRPEEPPSFPEYEPGADYGAENEARADELEHAADLHLAFSDPYAYEQLQRENLHVPEHETAPQPESAGVPEERIGEGEAGNPIAPDAGPDDWVAEPHRGAEAEGDLAQPPSIGPGVTAEPGAEGLPQTILPGAEQSARQLAAAREAQGRGRMEVRAEQQGPGGMFEKESPAEPTLFEQQARGVESPDQVARPSPVNERAAPEAVPSRSRALKPIEGTGEERQRAINGEIYNVGEEAPQKEAAERLVEKNPERAVAIAMRQKPPPPGVHPEFVYMAVEAKAIRDGDIDLQRRLSVSQIAAEATTMGQRIAAWRNRTEISAVEDMRKIQDARATMLKQRRVDVPKETEKIVKQAKSEIKRTSASAKRPTWESFIKDITCGY